MCIRDRCLSPMCWVKKQLRLHTHDVDREWFAPNSKNEHGWTYFKNCIFVRQYPCRHLENKICQNVLFLPPSFVRTFSSGERHLRTRQRVHCFEALRQNYEDFQWGIHIVFKRAVYRKPCCKCLVKYQYILSLVSSFKQRDVGEILAVLQGRWSIIYFVLYSQF